MQQVNRIARHLRQPVPPPQLWGLWASDPKYPEGGFWVNHIHGPGKGRPQTYVSEQDAVDAAQGEIDGGTAEEIVAALIGTHPCESRVSTLRPSEDSPESQQ